MRLKNGDKIYCKKELDKSEYGLTIDKPYEVIYTNNWNGDDICILDNFGNNWWFGQIGETECWTNYFVSEKEWIREKLLNELGI